MFSNAFRFSRRASTLASRSISLQSTKVVDAARRSRVDFASIALVTAATALVTSKMFEDAECKEFPYTGVPGTSNERSFIAIKPDGVQRGLISEVIGRFEKKGYKLIAMKMIWPTREMAAQHYDDLKARPFFPALVKYFSSGPIIAMVWEGPAVIKTGRKILGATNPNAADIGTLRGDYCLTMGRNVIHGSDGPESAKHEISMWFTEDECSNWSRTLDTWIVAEN